MVRVCPECFNRPIFQRRVRELRAKSNSIEKCDRHPRRKGVQLDDLGPLIDTAFRANYGLGECYIQIEPGGWHHSALWQRFRRDVLHRQRFFNENARGLLTKIFQGVQFQADLRGRPALYVLAPSDNKKLFRARVISGEDQVQRVISDPAQELGPPPPQARRAGRMNAAGVPVFYGALDAHTAIAELRPSVGAELALASFKLARPIRVLDFTRFRGPVKNIDIFARNQVDRASQWAFMLSFAAEISKPILPVDEHLEYVPAQIVAEFLASTPMSWKGDSVTVDAIIFGSAQRRGGRNIAILGEAASVAQPPVCYATAPLRSGAQPSSPIRSAAINASCGMLTEPYSRIFDLPFFCFSSSFRFRVASPPPRLDANALPAWIDANDR